MIYLWRGGHSPELLHLLLSCWQQNQLLILCPDQLQDFTFLTAWPQTELFFCGEWSFGAIQSIKKITSVSRPESFAAAPQLGVFTSGTSTGCPRLVLYSRQNVMSSLLAVRQIFATEKIRRIFCYPRPTHTFGLTLGYLQAVLFQHELIIPSGRYGQTVHGHWIDCVDSHTLTLGVPTHFYDLIQFVKNKHHLPALSYSCIVGGAPVTVNLWEQLQSTLNILAPSIGYGATECSPGICHLPPGRKPSEDGELGPVLNGVQIQPGPNGLRVDGLNVAMSTYENGQWSHLQNTVQLGDLVRRREEDGVFIYESRVTSQLNRGGLKYSLEQIEKALEAITNQPFVCVPVKHERLGEDLAVLTAKKLSPDRRAEIIQLLLEKYNIRLDLNLYRELSELPLNSSGKIDRPACSLLFKNVFDF